MVRRAVRVQATQPIRLGKEVIASSLVIGGGAVGATMDADEGLQSDATKQGSALPHECLQVGLLDEGVAKAKVDLV